jgi:hypothetical protein
MVWVLHDQPSDAQPHREQPVRDAKPRWLNPRATQPPSSLLPRHIHDEDQDEASEECPADVAVLGKTGNERRERHQA